MKSLLDESVLRFLHVDHEPLHAPFQIPNAHQTFIQTLASPLSTSLPKEKAHG